MRTGSIVPGVVFHWANNTVAYLIAVAYPGNEVKLVDIFSGNETAVLMSVVFSLCIFLPALFQLNICTKTRGLTTLVCYEKFERTETSQFHFRFIKHDFIL